MYCSKFIKVQNLRGDSLLILLPTCIILSKVNVRSLLTYRLCKIIIFLLRDTLRDILLMAQVTCACACGNYWIWHGESYLPQGARNLYHGRLISLCSILCSYRIDISVMSRCLRKQGVFVAPNRLYSSVLQLCATTVIPSIRVTAGIIQATQCSSELICSAVICSYIKELSQLRGQSWSASFIIPYPHVVLVTVIVLLHNSVAVICISPILPYTLVYTVVLATDISISEVSRLFVSSHSADTSITQNQWIIIEIVVGHRTEE